MPLQFNNIFTRVGFGVFEIHCNAIIDDGLCASIVFIQLVLVNAVGAGVYVARVVIACLGKGRIVLVCTIDKRGIKTLARCERLSRDSAPYSISIATTDSNNTDTSATGCG